MPLFKHDNVGILCLPDELCSDNTLTVTAFERHGTGAPSIAAVTLHIDQLCEIADHLDQLLDPLPAVDAMLEKDEPASTFLHLFTFFVDNPTITQISTTAMYASSDQLAGHGLQTKHGPTLPMVNCASPFDKPKYKLVDQYGLLVKAPKKFREGWM